MTAAQIAAIRWVIKPGGPIRAADATIALAPEERHSVSWARNFVQLLLVRLTAPRGAVHGTGIGLNLQQIRGGPCSEGPLPREL